MSNNIIVNDGFSKDNESVYRALSDDEFRKSLAGRADLDPGFRDLMRMMDDPVYIKLTHDVNAGSKRIYHTGMGISKQMEDDLQKLEDYASVQYPEGWKLIKEYGDASGNCLTRKALIVLITHNPISLCIAVAYV